MCKNLFIPGIKKEIAKEKLWSFLFTIQQLMSVNDKDGVGFAAVSPKGIWGERWLDPTDAFIDRPEWTEKDQKVRTKFNSVVKGGPIYNSFGEIDPDNTQAVILHARMATCEKTMENVHPFVKDGVALVHNGVIRNDDKLTKEMSTCDSETILHEYLSKNIAHHPEDIQKMIGRLQGYYACGILGKDTNGVDFLDVFRDNAAQLYLSEVKELDTIVICTSSWMIKQAVEQLKWERGATFSLDPAKLVRFNAETGEIMGHWNFKAEYDYTTHYTSFDRNRWDGKSNEEKKSPLTLLPTTTLPKNSGGTTSNAQECTEEERAMADPFYTKGEGYASTKT